MDKFVIFVKTLLVQSDCPEMQKKTRLSAEIDETILKHNIDDINLISISKQYYVEL